MANLAHRLRKRFQIRPSGIVVEEEDRTGLLDDEKSAIGGGGDGGYQVGGGIGDSHRLSVGCPRPQSTIREGKFRRPVPTPVGGDRQVEQFTPTQLANPAIPLPPKSTVGNPQPQVATGVPNFKDFLPWRALRQCHRNQFAGAQREEVR